MIKALLLIFDPLATWEGIFHAKRGIGFIVAAFLLPLLLLTSATEVYGLVHWGKWQAEVNRFQKFAVGEAVVAAALQIVLALFVVWVGAKLVKSIGETFHGRHTFVQAFTTVAYGLSPLFLCHLLDAFPVASPWGPLAGWAIGIVLSVAVLYQGVPRMMEPDPAHAFGLYVMSALLLVLISGLVRLVTALCLDGRFPKAQAIISAIGGRLPF
jgi:hypothetical protein